MLQSLESECDNTLDLLEPYTGSKFFSADRYYQKDIQQHVQSSPAQFLLSEDPDDNDDHDFRLNLFRFQSLVLENESESQIHARSLLESWVHEKDVKSTILPVSELNTTLSELNMDTHISHAIHHQDIIAKETVVSAHHHYHPVKKNRQKMQIKKRNLQIQKKRMELKELQKQIEIKRVVEMEQIQENISRQKSIQEMQFEIQSRQNRKRELELERMKEEERTQQIQLGEKRAQEMFDMKRLKVLKLHFSALRLRVIEKNMLQERIRSVQDWKALHSVWDEWKQRCIQRKWKKETLKAKQLEKEWIEKNTKAIRYHQISLLSKLWILWQTKTRMKQEYTLLRQQHQKRSLKIISFLSSVSEMHSSTQVEDVGLTNDSTPQKISFQEQRASSTTLYDGSTPIQPTSSKVCPIKRTQKDLEFIQRMEQRDQERKARRAAFEEVKKQKELELQEFQQRQEQERVEQEAQQKRLLKLQRLDLEAKARQEQENKQLEKQKLLELCQTAKDHYKKRLFSRIILSTLKKCSQITKENDQQAEIYQQNSYIKFGFQKWQRELRKRQQEKEIKADIYLKTKNLISTWSLLKIEYEKHCMNKKKSINQDTIKSLFHFIRIWKDRYQKVVLEKMQREKLLNDVADQHASICVPKRCIRRWKKFIEMEKEERWKEYRKQMMRDSVKVIYSTLVQTSLMIKSLLRTSKLEETLACVHIHPTFDS